MLTSLHLCLAPLGYSLACLPTCLLDNSTIILLLIVVKSLKSLLILFFKTVLFFVYVPISYIDIIFLYPYRSPVSVPFSCIHTDLLYWYYFPDSDIYYAYYLTRDSCMLSPGTCLISLITCHLIHYCLPCDYHISGILYCYPVLYTVTLFLVFMYSCNS